MAWYDRGRKKQKSKSQSTHTVTCEECGLRHRALDGGWVCNGRGEVLCHGQGKCFEVRMLRAMGRTNQEEHGAETYEGQGEMELP